MNSAIGQPITRIDGRKKVTGAAPYGVEHALPNLVYGVGVPSRIGRGRITRIDTSTAERMPGVIAVLHHANAPRLHRPAGRFEESSRPGESRPPLADDMVYYYGQFVALVVAETFEQAQDAAWHVRVDYASAPPQIALDQAPNKHGDPAAKYARGDAETAYQQAAVKLESTYDIPVETHNPMELHGSIAVWDKDKLTLYETTQGVVNHQNVASQVLGVPLESIEVVSLFVGSGFGSKLFPWPHSWLAAMAARQVELPVKSWCRAR
jgi:xanthine dehydrogenase YagR molybdenum-binding subunit